MNTLIFIYCCSCSVDMACALCVFNILSDKCYVFNIFSKWKRLLQMHALCSLSICCSVLLGFKGLLKCEACNKKLGNIAYEPTLKVDCNKLMYLLTSGGEFPIHSLNKRKRQQGESEEQWWIEFQSNDGSQSTTVHYLSSGKQTNIKTAMNEHYCIVANVVGWTER